MDDKCFCHLNGYRVKDAEARQRLRVLETLGTDYQLNIPVGLGIASDYKVINNGATYYSNELSSECYPELATLIKKIENEYSEVLSDELEHYLFPIKLNNTSSEGTVGEITQINPHPRSIKLEIGQITRIDENQSSNIIVLRGYVQGGEHLISTDYETKEQARLSISYQITASGDIEITSASLVMITYELTTKDYVDRAVENIEAPESSSSNIYPMSLDIDNYYFTGNKQFVASSTTAEIVRSVLQKIIDDGNIDDFKIILRNENNSNEPSKEFVITDNFSTTQGLKYIRFTGSGNLYLYGAYVYSKMSNQTIENCVLQIPIRYNSGHTIEISGKCTISCSSDTFLSCNNQQSYTPSSNYHPATKKYVDDHTINKTKVSGTIEVTEQGILQGTIAMPSGWTHTNSCILHIHYINPSTNDRVTIGLSSLLATNYIWCKFEDDALSVGSYNVECTLMKI